MQYTSFEQIFKDFENQQVLIIGDVMIDSYLWGSVDRVSPEAPVPVVGVKKRETRMGGAANVGINIGAMGAKPILCSVVGEDEDGNALLGILDELNFSKEGIVRSKTRQTTVKHRIIAGSQQLLRVDAEDTHAINEEERSSLLAVIKKLLPKCSVVVFEDYDKGVITSALITEVVEAARKLDIPTVVDPKKRNFLAFKNVSLFKPNLKELKEGLNIHCDPSDVTSIEAAVKQLKKELGLQTALITLSEYGAYISSDKTKAQVKAHLRNIADVSGAGDTVISVASLCLALGLPEEIILELSNLAGGLVCEYLGVVPIDKETLLKEAKSQIKLKI